jgi:hypothetical protein
MKRDCDTKLEASAREHSEKLAALTKESQQKFDYQKRENDIKAEQTTRENADKLARLSAESQSKLSAMSLECHTKVSDTQRESHQKLTLAFGEHKRREDELTQSLERLRAEKDLSIRGISLDKERARAEFESHINDVELLAKRQEHNIVELRSQTLELRTHLVQKQDVEVQLSGERDRNEQMD